MHADAQREAAIVIWAAKASRLPGLTTPALRLLLQPLSTKALRDLRSILTNSHSLLDGSVPIPVVEVTRGIGHEHEHVETRAEDRRTPE